MCKKILLLLLLLYNGIALSGKDFPTEKDKDSLRNYVNVAFVKTYIKQIVDDPTSETQDKENGKLIVRILSDDFSKAINFDSLSNLLEHNGYGKTKAVLLPIIKGKTDDVFTSPIYGQWANNFFSIDNIGDFDKKIKIEDLANYKKTVDNWILDKAKSNEKNVKKTTIKNEKELMPFGMQVIVLILLVFYFVCLIALYCKYKDFVGKTEAKVKVVEERLKREQKDLQDELSHLKTKYQKIIHEMENNWEASFEILQNQIEKGKKEVVKSPTIKKDDEKEPQKQHIEPKVLSFADIDIENGLFRRVDKQQSRNSVYIIDEAQHTISLIEDIDLRASILSAASSSGVKDACEISGNFSKDKKIEIKPGKVSLDNGKWYLVEKIKIDIR